MRKIAKLREFRSSGEVCEGCIYGKIRSKNREVAKKLQNFANSQQRRSLRSCFLENIDTQIAKTFVQSGAPMINGRLPKVRLSIFCA